MGSFALRFDVCACFLGELEGRGWTVDEGSTQQKVLGAWGMSGAGAV